MTDRELMQQALDALDAYSWEQVQTATNALRDRLAQPKTPDVTPEVTPYVIDCPRCGHCCPQRPWVGLEQSDMPSEEHPMFDHQYFIAGMVYAAKVLEGKNT